MMRTTPKRIDVMAFVVQALAAVIVGRGVSGGEPAARVRRPEALALVDEGRLLLAANARSGSISVIDPIARRLLAEHDVGKGLVDLAPLPDGTHLLAVD